MVAVGAAVVASATACPGPVDYDFLKNPNAPAEMQTACHLMIRKCSACHDPERFSVYKPQSPERVGPLVERMRRLQGSNISVPEGERITDCLVYRNFGDEGLNKIHGVGAAGGGEND